VIALGCELGMAYQSILFNVKKKKKTQVRGKKKLKENGKWWVGGDEQRTCISNFIPCITYFF
jgi:hypothetical protein